MSESDRVLISECPGCQTRFEVTEEQLGVAKGRVRCGACLMVFDGRRAAVTGTTPVEGDPIDVLLATRVPRPDAESADVRTTGAGEAPSPTATDGIEPSSGEAGKVRRDTHPVVFAVAIAAALALLAAAALVLQYDVYSQRPEMRELYEALGFELPRYKALDAIRVVNPSVDERLGNPHDLVVRLDLANTAPLSQRLPSLVVRFRDAHGSILAERRIEPAEYLPSPTHTRRMLPNRNFPVSLRLDDPGAEAASYSISLL